MYAYCFFSQLLSAVKIIGQQQTEEKSKIKNNQNEKGQIFKKAEFK